jgi:hypothetical protein
MIRSILLLLASSAVASVVGAQELPGIRPGARLRVTMLSPPQVHVGRLEMLTDSTLVLSGNAAIRLLNIRRLEASGGRQPGTLAAVAGFVLGASLGGVLGCAVNRDSYGVFCGGQNDTKVALGAGIGGVAGAAAGAFLGRRERWIRVDLGRPGQNPP